MNNKQMITSVIEKCSPVKRNRKCHEERGGDILNRTVRTGFAERGNLI